MCGQSSASSGQVGGVTTAAQTHADTSCNVLIKDILMITAQCVIQPASLFLEIVRNFVKEWKKEGQREGNMR